MAAGTLYSKSHSISRAHKKVYFRWKIILFWNLPTQNQCSIWHSGLVQPGFDSLLPNRHNNSWHTGPPGQERQARFSPCLDFGFQYALIRNNRSRNFGVEYWTFPGSNSPWRPWHKLWIVKNDLDEKHPKYFSTDLFDQIISYSFFAHPNVLFYHIPVFVIDIFFSLLILAAGSLVVLAKVCG